MTNYSPTHREANPQLTPNTKMDNGVLTDKIQFIRNLKRKKYKKKYKKQYKWKKISNPFEQIREKGEK